MRKPSPATVGLRLSATGQIQALSWLQWFGSFDDYYQQVFRWVDPYNPSFGKVEPPTKARVDGLLAYADGVAWNPGGDAGYYRWDGAAWQKLEGGGGGVTWPLEMTLLTTDPVPSATKVKFYAWTNGLASPNKQIAIKMMLTDGTQIILGDYTI